MNQTKLLQYSVLGTAFVISVLDEKTLSQVNAVYLFGSVARGTAKESSDIDVFFDVTLSLTKQKVVRKRIATLYGLFRVSTEGLRFRADGIENEFAPIAGVFTAWKDLHKSTARTGLQVYGQAHLSISGGEPWTIISWEKAKNRGAFLNAVYGYTIKKKKYLGFVQKLNGLRIGKSTIALPACSVQSFNRLLEKYQVQYKLFEFSR